MRKIMKFDIVKSIIAVAMSALLAYACYEICNHEHIQWVIAVGAFITLAVPMTAALGVSVQQERGTIVLKTLSWVILLAELITNGIFAFIDFSIPAYVIINGLILMIFALAYNSIYRSRM